MNAASPARIRRMTATDIDRVMEIAASLDQTPHWAPGAYRAALDPEAAPPRIALVAEEAGDGASPLGADAVAGFAVASLMPPEAELESIAVAAARQRRGLARRLIAALGEELARAGVAEVLLEVRASNQPALGLYRALGFVEAGRRPRYYREPVEDALLLRLRLGGLRAFEP